MSQSGWNMYVFRDGRRFVAGQRLVAELRAGLEALCRDANRDRILDALITAGELECALLDAAPAADDHSLRSAACITDGLAAMLVANAGTFGEADVSSPASSSLSVQQLLASLDRIEAPERLRLSVHEGFAYYALHPLKIVDLLDYLPAPPRVAVLGIRSIGATLSAVLAAALRQRGAAAERITVRPEGHPYDRRLSLDPCQRAWIEKHRGDEFMVIDEGPGLSGSSFLAVAEGLTGAGVPAERILLIGSRWPEVSQLRAHDAVERWSRFRFTCLASHPYIPKDAAIAIGGGVWRGEFAVSEKVRPASWTDLEMAKFLSADRRRFFKFEGLGHFGAEIGRRARALAEAGLAPAYLGNEAGFGIYEVRAGRMLERADLSELLLRHLARYCAFRLREFAADDSQPSAIDEMAAWNWSLEFQQPNEPEFVGDPAQHPNEPEFVGDPVCERDFLPGAVEVKHRIFCDAHMMPHEWLALPEGGVLKLDGASHADDHFFPGPCDIAWDLAGTIVEWELRPAERDFFLESYRLASGDDARHRLPAYLKAYTAFRMGWSKMAALASAGRPDEPLLWRDFERYRGYAARLAGDAAAQPQPVKLNQEASEGQVDGLEPTSANR